MGIAAVAERYSPATVRTQDSVRIRPLHCSNAHSGLQTCDQTLAIHAQPGSGNPRKMNTTYFLFTYFITE